MVDTPTPRVGKEPPLLKNRMAVVGLLGGLVIGGIVGVALGVPAVSGAQSTPSTPGTTLAPSSPAAGKPTSNEDPTHEKSESAAREAEEATGHFGGRHHGSNEDTTHEKSESAAREAAENAAASSSPTAPANGG